jgi:DNA-binding transcriptional ArsR family regulator
MNDLQQTSPELKWEFGTGYEFLISLHVIHNPEKFGIRAAWAAGVRSRIPAAERKLLEELIPFIGFPLEWVHSLPGEKDAISVLWALKQLPPAERLPKMLGTCCSESEWDKIMLDIQARGKWEQSHLDGLKALAMKEGKEKFDEEKFVRFLDRWQAQDALGEGFLTALQAYYNAFFEEEEKRLAPILKAGLARARDLSEHMSVEALLQELSQGVNSREFMEAKTLVIAPAYWTTPLILYSPINKDSMLFFFGARPADMPIIPGEMVPDSLLLTMKALADPTRLKILYYLTQEELTPSELSRRLHLRAPTITHHLNDLRLSGLVHMIVKGQERRYRSRTEALDVMCTNLKNFLNTPKPEAGK